MQLGDLSVRVPAGQDIGDWLFRYLMQGAVVGSQTSPSNAPPFQPSYCVVLGGSYPPAYVTTSASSAFIQRSDRGISWWAPTDDNLFKAATKELETRITAGTTIVQRRGYGVTNSKSCRPMLSTTGLAACICVIMYQGNEAALAHFDKEQDLSSIDRMTSEFELNAPIDVILYGGKQMGSSIDTVKGLLAALYNTERTLGAQFNIRAFDVIDRPHSPSITFDTTDRTVYPGYPNTISFVQLDSCLRYCPVPEPMGTFVTGVDGRDLMMDWNALPAGNNKTKILEYSATLRQQFDMRPAHVVQWRERAQRIIYGYAAKHAIQLAGAGSEDDMVFALRDLNQLERVELSLRKFNPTDSRSVIQVLSSCANTGEYTPELKRWSDTNI